MRDRMGVTVSPAQPQAPSEPLLSVKRLTVEFPVAKRKVRAVADISFSLNEGEAIGIVGESGSGKTVTALSIMGLLSDPGKVVGGKVVFNGTDITKMHEKELLALRGCEIAMVFQDPQSSLNPVMTVGRQIVETLRAHQKISRARAWRICEDLLDEVGLPEPHRRARQFPHQLSGGMRQRVGIAIAVANAPKLLIADEPTTALDVTVQAEILGLLNRLSIERGMALILISHDLAVVAQAVDRVCVIYAGAMVELGPVGQVFSEPQHPYTMGLLASLPPLNRKVRRLRSISGAPPDRSEMPQGCSFWPRCEFVRKVCSLAPPGLTGSEEHRAACVLNSQERLEARSRWKVRDAQ